MKSVIYSICFVYDKPFVMIDDNYSQSSTAGNHSTLHIFERLHCLIMLNCELANVRKK